MSFVSWFWFFMAVIGWIVGWIGLNAKEKTDRENKQLREVLQIEHNRKEYFKQRAYKYEHFYDFEKNNKTKEK